MKVLFVDQFGKTTGRDTLALAELLNQNQDIEMQVYLSDNTEIPTQKRYSVNIQKGFHGAYEGSFVHKALCYLKALIELKQYIIVTKPDIVHLQWFSLPWLEWIYVNGIKKKSKLIITVHDVIPFDNRPFEMQCLNKIYSRADMLVMHTESSKKLFNKTYSAMTPISVVTQGFCLKRDYTKIDSILAKKHFGIPDDAVVFLYYGTIRPSKGLDILIKAIHSAHDENKKIYLLAAGAFHKVNEEEYKNLVKNELKSEYSTINFGFVPQDEEKWYFSAADVVCLPYLEVTQSGVAQLGLMYDLPIIATMIGEMNDVCRNNVNGLLVKPGNVKDLTAAIIRLAADDAFRKKASYESKVLGETEFSLQIKADKIAEAYRKI